MDSTVRIEVAGANVNPQGNAGATKSGAGFGKVVMFGTVPGILLGAAGISAAAYAVSDDFDAVVIDVCNNGHPISPDSQEQIFIPFFTTKPEGSGIGLSLSRQIMRLHNGSIRLIRSNEHETVFSIVFR